MSAPSIFVAVAGASGHMGKEIATILRARNIAVKALVRPNTDPAKTADLRRAGVIIAEVDMNDVSALTKELEGVTALVSALNGIAPVILGVQKALLDAAVAAKPGTNRNLDLRRQFHTHLDESGIAWTSIFNGGFMDMLAADLPVINDKYHRVLYWGSKNQPLDFTAIADTAAFTAAAAVDPNPTPRFLRIAGQTVTPVELAAIAGKARGGKYAPLWLGSTGFLGGMASFMRRFGIGGKETDVFPAWQGMQYIINMNSGDGKLDPLDNDRYPDVKWTQIEEVLRRKRD